MMIWHSSEMGCRGGDDHGSVDGLSVDAKAANGVKEAVEACDNNKGKYLCLKYDGNQAWYLWLWHVLWWGTVSEVTDKPLTINSNTGAVLSYKHDKIGSMCFWLNLMELPASFPLNPSRSIVMGSMTERRIEESLFARPLWASGIPVLSQDQFPLHQSWWSCLECCSNHGAKNHKTFLGDTHEEVEHSIDTCKAKAYSDHPSEKVFKKRRAVREQALYLDL